MSEPRANHVLISASPRVVEREVLSRTFHVLTGGDINHHHLSSKYKGGGECV